MALTARSRRCYHRVMSGLERGGSLRFLTLTSSLDAPDDIQKSWKALYMRMKRRGLIKGYIKVPEKTQAGKLHLHVLFRGSYVEQRLLSVWWSEIHQSQVVDIRSFRPYKGKRACASYMAKYMSKGGAGRYSWSWEWVWKGFCRDWTMFKKYWREHLEPLPGGEFANCIRHWGLWLHGKITIDKGNMALGMPAYYVLKYQKGA